MRFLAFAFIGLLASCAWIVLARAAHFSDWDVAWWAGCLSGTFGAIGLWGRS